MTNTPWPVPGPYASLDTVVVIDRALLELADRRFMTSLDPRTQLHLLASIIAQAEVWVGEQVAVARGDDVGWSDIGRLLGTTATAARQRWAPTTTRRRAPASFASKAKR